MSSLASRLVPACQELADALTAAGVPATLNRADLQVGAGNGRRGGAWVRPDSFSTGQTLAGGGTARVSVLLVAPAAKDKEALQDLAALLELALPVLTELGTLVPAAEDEDVDTTVLLNVRNNNLPAFRLAADLDL